MKRRNFIKASALASTSLMVPSFLSGFDRPSNFRSRSGKVLVVVQLSGGNDGLNTLVPFRNDIYYRSRPTLAVKKEEVIRLNDELGLNPAMESLRPIYEQGYLAIVNSVGYPNPDRSHFRSMDIWHTASNSNEYLSSGWLGRYLDSNCEGCANPYHAIELDDSLSLAMKGEQRIGFAMSNPGRLKRTTDNRFLKAAGTAGYRHEDEIVAYLYKTMIDTQSSANYLFEKSHVYQSGMDYPQTAFGRDLRQVAELITADTDTSVYYLSLSGFDTHANQKNQQERLLRQYAEGMKAFVADLEQQGLLKETLILTFSEFGRRVQQNGSNGTDHGTANNLFVIGGDLRSPGIYNSGPQLDKLDDGDLVFEIDFRQVYATILEEWLGADAHAILGASFAPLPLV